jgi:hypothetical protein
MSDVGQTSVTKPNFEHKKSQRKSRTCNTIAACKKQVRVVNVLYGTMKLSHFVLLPTTAAAFVPQLLSHRKPAFTLAVGQKEETADAKVKVDVPDDEVATRISKEFESMDPSTVDAINKNQEEDPQDVEREQQDSHEPPHPDRIFNAEDLWTFHSHRF